MIRPKNIVLLSATVVSALAILEGCSNPSVNTVDRDKPTYHADVIKDRRIVTDSDLAQKMQIIQVRQATVQDDLLKISVEVVNTQNAPADVDYKFEWFDGQGMPVDTPNSSWTSVRLQAQEPISIDQVAPNPKCKDFRLKMQQSVRD